jgi:carbonic anhydrase/acetyltransferase-like protein (isoleucine patch superfamily)
MVEDFTELARTVRLEPPARVMEMVEVSGTGLISGNSTVRGQAIVVDNPRIEDCDIHGFCIISGAPFLYQALINEHAIISGRPSITQSQISGTARVHDDAVVNRSIVDGNAMVGRNAIVQNSHLHGNVVVIGGELHGVNLQLNERVHEGIWHRAPRHLGHPAVPMTMTECVRGNVIIGCLCRSVEWWKTNAERMQQEYGWSDEAVQFVWSNIDFVAYGKNAQHKKETT